MPLDGHLSFSLPPLTIEIVDGDIVAQSIDAIVNAANNVFWMGSGVAGAIKAGGGQTIETEAMAQGPVEPGECVVTSGGRLAARHVIHACARVMIEAVSARRPAATSVRLVFFGQTAYDAFVGVARELLGDGGQAT